MQIFIFKSFVFGPSCSPLGRIEAKMFSFWKEALGSIPAFSKCYFSPWVIGSGENWERADLKLFWGLNKPSLGQKTVCDCFPVKILQEKKNHRLVLSKQIWNIVFQNRRNKKNLVSDNRFKKWRPLNWKQSILIFYTFLMVQYLGRGCSTADVALVRQTGGSRVWILPCWGLLSSSLDYYVS